MTSSETQLGSGGPRRWHARGRRGLLGVIAILVVRGLLGVIAILVVVAIVGHGLIRPRVLNYLGELKVAAAKIQCQSFASALDLLLLDAGRYPSTSEGLDALVRPVPGLPGWNGPYLKGGALPNDPWGKPYIYRSPVESMGHETALYEIKSSGVDGQYRYVCFRAEFLRAGPGAPESFERQGG
jgi:general secretion pathway protein G